MDRPECVAAGYRKGSSLFSRITLIIVAIFAIFILFNCSWNLFILNKVSGNACNLSGSEISTARGINIFGIIASIFVILFVLYNFIFPEGTFKQYVVQPLEQPSSGLPILRRKLAVESE